MVRGGPEPPGPSGETASSTAIRRLEIEMDDRPLAAPPHAAVRRAPRHRWMAARLGALALVVPAVTTLAGCVAFELAGALQQNAEYQKLIEVPAVYDDLEGRTIAVVVDTDLATRHQFPTLVPSLSQGIALQLQKHVEGTRFVHPQDVQKWQYRTPQWNALPPGEIAEQLGVERVVYIDVYEFRLNPPGNSWQWEGVAAANVGVVEQDGILTDVFADEYQVSATFPNVSYVTREAATAGQISYGLLDTFIDRIAYLFYTHLEPKYPDKYRPELDTTRTSS